MEWITLIINASVTALMLGVTGWLFKKWMITVDDKLKELDKSLEDIKENQHKIDLKLEGLPSTYVTKIDFAEEKDHTSKSRENIWKELNAFKEKTSERLTVLETYIKIKGKK